MLRNILNRHPRLAVQVETQFYNLVYSRRRVFGDLAKLAVRRRVVQEYLATEQARRCGFEGAQDLFLRNATSYRDLFASMLEHYGSSQGKQRWGEKSPQHSLFTETLCTWFPGAAILHIVRDPRDVVASLQRMPWAAKHVIINALLWRRYNRAASRSSHRAEYLRIDYESLVRDPEKEATRICAHLGEAYSPLMLVPSEAVESGRPGGSLTSSNIGKWQRELIGDEVALIEWTAGADLLRFGFSKTCATPDPLMIARGLAGAGSDACRWFMRHPASLYRIFAPKRISKAEFKRARTDAGDSAKAIGVGGNPRL